jgi:outer membrane lipoprotein-sorting protein
MSHMHVRPRALAVRLRAAVVCAASIATCLLATAMSAQQKPAAPPAATDDASFDALYKRGSQINATLKTLTARFTETTTSSLLTRDLVSRGTVAVERPSRVVLRYEEPEPRVVLIDGDKLTMVWPGRNVRQTSNIASAQRRVQRYFVDSTPKELREHFSIESRAAEDRPGTYKLTMVPTRKQIREGLSRLELWLNRSSLLLDGMRMTFPNGDTKLMVFEDVRPNVPVDPAAFRIQP